MKGGNDDLRNLIMLIEDFSLFQPLSPSLDISNLSLPHWHYSHA